MIGRAVADGLQGEGHAVDLVFDGAAAELALLHGPYDLAVLDLGLPRKDGFEVLKSLRRARIEVPVLTYGALTLDPVKRAVSLRGTPVELSSREFAVLEALMREPGAVVSRSKLEDSVYGWGEEVGSNSVEVHLHHLRRKLDPTLIRNVRGVGYRVARLD